MFNYYTKRKNYKKEETKKVPIKKKKKEKKIPRNKPINEVKEFYSKKL